MPTVTLTWHARKYEVRKLNERYILKLEATRVFVVVLVLRISSVINSLVCWFYNQLSLFRPKECSLESHRSEPLPFFFFFFFSPFFFFSFSLAVCQVQFYYVFEIRNLIVASKIMIVLSFFWYFWHCFSPLVFCTGYFDASVCTLVSIE